MTFDINLPLQSFPVDIPTVEAWVRANASFGSTYIGCSLDYDLSLHYSAQPDSNTITNVEAYWAALTTSSPEATNYTSNAAKAAIKTAINNAKAFGLNLATTFSAENEQLGIETSSSPTTDQVLTTMQGVLDATQAGSLKVAISRAKAIPSGSFDSTFVTGARLLAYVNQCETYLGLSLSTQWW